MYVHSYVYVCIEHTYLACTVCVYSSPCSKLTLHSDCCMAFGSCREVLPSFCELLQLYASNPVSVFSEPSYSNVCVLYMYRCMYIHVYVYVRIYIRILCIRTYVGMYIHMYKCIHCCLNMCVYAHTVPILL